MLSLLSLVSLALYVSAQTDGPGVASVTASPRPNVASLAEANGVTVREQLLAEVAKASAKHHWRLHGSLHNATHHAHHHGHNATHHHRRAVGTSSPVLNPQGNTLYYSALSVGTPAQTSPTVQWDTGSSDLWFPVSGCVNTQKGGTCKANGAIYNSAASSSFNNPTLPPQQGQKFSAGYMDGTMVNGLTATEQVSFPGLPAITFNFGAVTMANDKILDEPNLGLCGLGFPSQASTANSLPFSYMAAGLLSENIFGLRYTAADSGLPSILTFGGPAVSTSSAYSYTNLIPNAQEWLVQATGSVVNGVAKGSPFNVNVDSGTSINILPIDNARAFWSGVPGAVEQAPAADGTLTWKYPCNFAGTVGFTFNGFSQPILFNPALLNAGDAPDANNLCSGTITGQNNMGFGNQLFGLLGDSFLASVPVVYDMGNLRLGFISAASTPTPSGMRKIRARNSEKRRERVRREQAAAALHIVD